MLRICISNLGKYAEGIRFDKWIELPISRDDYEKALDDIRVCNVCNNYFDSAGNPYEEAFISDFDTDTGIEITEHMDISRLNEMAKLVAHYTEEQLGVLRGLLDIGFEFCKAVELVDAKRYVIYNKCRNMAEVAREMVCDEYQILKKSLPRIPLHFDYEAIGRDLEIAQNWCETPDGMCRLMVA